MAMRCRCAGERRLVPGVAVSSPHLCAAMPSDREAESKAIRRGSRYSWGSSEGSRRQVPASSEGVRPPLRRGGRRSPRCPVPVVPVLSRCSVRGLSATRLRAG